MPGRAAMERRTFSGTASAAARSPAEYRKAQNRSVAWQRVMPLRYPMQATAHGADQHRSGAPNNTGPNTPPSEHVPSIMKPIIDVLALDVGVRFIPDVVDRLSYRLFFPIP